MHQEVQAEAKGQKARRQTAEAQQDQVHNREAEQHFPLSLWLIDGPGLNP